MGVISHPIAHVLSSSLGMVSDFDPRTLDAIIQLLLDGDAYGTDWASLPYLADNRTSLGTYRPPRLGHVATFDGTDDYAIVANPLAAHTSSFTLCTWIYLDQTSSEPVIFGGDTQEVELRLLNTVRRVQFVVTSPSATNLFTDVDDVILLDGWSHVTAIYDQATTELRLHIDSVLVKTVTANSATVNHATSLQLGARGLTNRLNGSLFDARIYTTVKTPAEIAAIYAGDYSAPDTTGLVAGYWLNEESGTTHYDWSGNGNDLTITNANTVLGGTYHAADATVANPANTLGYTDYSYTSNFSAGVDGWAVLAATVTGNIDSIGGLDDCLRITLSGGSTVHYIKKAILPTGEELEFEMDVYIPSANAALDSLKVTDAGPSESSVFNPIAKDQWVTINGVFANGSTDGSMYIVPNDGGSNTVNGDGDVIYIRNIRVRNTSDTTENTAIIPRDESTPANDVLGNPLEYTGLAHNVGQVDVPCLTFDGTTQYARASYAQASPTSMTVAFWVEDLGSTNGTRWVAVGSNLDRGIDIRPAASGFDLVLATTGANFTTYTYSGGALSGTNHIAIAFAGTTVTAYLNGVLVSTTPAVTGTGFSGTQSTVENITLGATTNSTPSGHSNSVLSDIRVYNVAKDLAEIQAIKAGVLDQTGLVLHYPLQEGPGTSNTNRTIYDVSGNGNHGTLTNGSVVDAWANRTDVVKDWSIENGGDLGRNLLAYSETISNAAWVKTNATVSGQDIIEDTNNSQHYIHQIYSSTAGLTYTTSVIAKAKERSILRLNAGFGTGLTLSDRTAEFDLINGTVLVSPTGDSTARITADADGSYLCEMTYTPSSTSSTDGIYISLHNGTSHIYLGDGTSGLTVLSTQIEQGTKATSHQATGATAYATDSFVPGLPSLPNAANSNPKTLSPGKLGNPHSRINFDPFDAPEVHHLNLESAYTKGDNRQVIAPTNTKFRRTMADGDDRFLAYNATLAGQYDVDALNYFARAEALGGSFNLTSINATYTDTYVKTAFNDYVLGLKSDNVWSKVTELYPLTGVSFDGLMAKLKYDSVATLTNNNFVAGDLVAAGSGAGLVGDGSTKTLEANCNVNILPIGNRHLGVYITDYGAIATKTLLGTNPGGAYANFTAIAKQGSGGIKNYLSGSPVFQGNRVVPDDPAHIIASSESSTQIKAFSNGALVDTDTISAATLADVPLYVFSENRDGFPKDFYDGRLSFVHIGLGLTDTEAANLSTRTNALMTALGANVY
jgi:hypothetical protein